MDESMMYRVAEAMVRDRLRSKEPIRPNSEEMMDARAALEALLEPSDAMIAAADEALRDPRIKTRRLAALTAWKVMVQTALAEPMENRQV